MSEIVAEGILPAADLQQFVDIVSSLLNECKIHFNDDGLVTRGVEATTAAMYHPVHLTTDAFESYDAPGSVTIGVNLERLDEVLGPASGDDLVNIRVDMETRKLLVDFRTISQVVRLVDTENIRAEPDKSDLDLPNEFTADGASFSEAIRVCDTVSDHVRLIGDADDGTVTWDADRDDDAASVTFDGGILDGHDITASVNSLFSLQYLRDIFPTAPSDAAITVRFGEDYPMEFAYRASDGDIRVEGMVAPRLEDGT